MTFTLIIYIYIYIDLPYFVNLAMYCYRHVLRIFCYYMTLYSRMCNVTEQVSHFDSVDRHKTGIRGKHLSDHRNKGACVFCII